jgi:predicted ATP-grasp superfamily ATP-dependent carboligase
MSHRTDRRSESAPGGSPTLLIVGASTRAAALSAVRAGFVPWCIDLFADRDLAALGRADRVIPSSYPAGLEAIAADGPPCPWIYTGAIENHPGLVDRLSRSRPLWGVGGPSLSACRDPFQVREALLRAGLPAPDLRERADGLPRDGSWLVKPRKSGGGSGIRPLSAQAPDPGSEQYVQKWLRGEPLSALFIGHGGAASLLGVTRQRLGKPGEPYGYAGGIGPWPVTPGLQSRLSRLGDALAEAFELRGLFGVDFVRQDEEPWTVEVNPRYTASAEVLELAAGRPLLADHAGAFGATVEASASPCYPDRYVGKAILYADRPCRFPERCGWEPPACGPWDWREIADVPWPGDCFDAGQPVLTVFARGDDPPECERRLGEALDRWASRLVPT